MRIELVWLDKSELPAEGKSQCLELSTVPRVGEMLAIEKSGDKPTIDYFDVANVIHSFQLAGEAAQNEKISVYIREADEPYRKPSTTRFGFGGR
ncbi:hypothetical protein BH10PLA2_BH10PLA2_31900 [soil metagenome]